MTKDELIDKYRYDLCDLEWWDCTFDDTKTDMLELGFMVDDIYFSGFASQGDGACFVGHMTDWTKFCEGVPEFVRDFPYLSKFVVAEGAEYSITHSGHYNHEYCTSHEYSDDLDNWLEVNEICDDDIGPDEDISTQELMEFALYTKAADESGVEKWLTEFFRGKMREVYEALEAENDYLTSDETVWDMIVANGLDSELEEEDGDEHAEQTGVDSIVAHSA